LASKLETSDQAKVWGIWRGFFFGRIREARLDSSGLKYLLLVLCSFGIGSILAIWIIWFWLNRMVSLSDIILAQRHLPVLRTDTSGHAPVTRVDEEQPLIDLSED